MVPSLRKKHRWVWFGMVFVLPTLFAISVANIPDRVYQNLPSYDIPAPYARQLDEQKTDGIIWRLREQGEGRRQIEVLARPPLATPAPALFFFESAEAPVERGRLLGSLSDPELHRFNLDSLDSRRSEYHLKIYDTIKGNVVASVSLQAER